MSGADAIAILPPFAPQKPPTIDILVDIMVKIASSTKLPLFYYHFPGQTGVTFPFADILARALPRVPTLAGVKFVSDLGDFANVIEIAPPGFKLFWAPEPKIQAMPYGITRYVLAESYYAPYLADVLDAYEAGNIPLAEQKQQRLNSLQNIINAVGGNREVMKMLGIDMGPARLPGAPNIPQKDYDSLQDALVKWGFFNNTRAY
jgi:N-acetylneuraminate lyase